MSPENFTYWLAGFFEISQHSDGPKALNEEQVEEIRNHLNLVLRKVTPEISSTKETQVPPPFPDISQMTYCATSIPDFSKILSTPIGEVKTFVEVKTCGADDPTFLEQFRIDEEEKKKYKKLTQPYGGYKTAREPGRAC
jgi:hypothetical protein